MQLAVVIGKAISTIKHEAYDSTKLMVVQPLNLDGSPKGNSTLAVDYVGSGEGEVVLLGAAPGLAKVVFGLEVAPIREMIMGIVDYIDIPENKKK